MNPRAAGERCILHVDMDAFFASVEQLDHPEYRGKPVIVGAAPNERGVVSAASYEARTFGVRSAMPSRTAGRLCPGGIFVPPRMKRYEEVSRRVLEIFERFTPLVEPLSIDEAFLDVTGSRALFGTGEEIGVRIRAAIRGELGLTASIGVAPNKFLAKLGSELKKPDGMTVLPTSASEILAFLSPLPVGRLWGVGQVTRRILEDAGLKTIGDIQRSALSNLEKLVGAHTARHLRLLSFGQDAREVETGCREKSISREVTFSRDVSDAARLRRVLGELADDVGMTLRAEGLYAGTARLKLRWDTFETLTRMKSLGRSCCDDATLRQAARALLAAIPLERPVRLIGFGVTRLSDHPSEQMELFDLATGGAAPVRREKLSRSVDDIKRRYGAGSIRRGEELDGPGAD